MKENLFVQMKGNKLNILNIVWISCGQTFTLRVFFVYEKFRFVKKGMLYKISFLYKCSYLLYISLFGKVKLIIYSRILPQFFLLLENIHAENDIDLLNEKNAIPVIVYLDKT